jgi:hypothetical protein
MPGYIWLPQSRAGLAQHRRRTAPTANATAAGVPVGVQGPEEGQTFYTTDPGKALLTGQCTDIPRVKGPILRNLAARPPYFHNGSAANLSQVVPDGAVVGADGGFDQFSANTVGRDRYPTSRRTG